MKYEPLNNQKIEAALSVVEQFLKDISCKPKDALRLRLAVEETMLQYQEQMGEGASFSLKCVKKIGKPRIELAFPGREADLFSAELDSDSAVMRGILVSMGVAPSWQYKRGCNLVVFTPPKKHISQMMLMICAVVLAVVLGMVCRYLPPELAHFLEYDLITPLNDTFMGILSAVAGPMIFLSVTWGIYSIGDTATLGQIGKHSIGRFLIISCVIGALTAAVMLPFFPVKLGGQGGTLHVRDMVDLVLDIFPDNLFAPFVEGNPVQIIVIAAAAGLLLLIFGPKAELVATFTEQCNYIVQFTMEAVGRLVPLFVFGSIFNIVLNDQMSEMGSAYKILPILLVVDLVWMAIYTAAVCIRKKVRPGILLKKLFPTFLIGITTASSSAAFATNVRCCENELGVDKRMVDFGVPLGQVIFMPGAVTLYLMAALCMGEIFQVEMTLSWLLMAVFICVVLAVASPPIPGGALTCYTMLFVQLGIPSEAVAVIVAVHILLDFLATAVNLYCLQTELIEVAGDLKLLNVETLRQGT